MPSRPTPSLWGADLQGGGGGAPSGLCCPANSQQILSLEMQGQDTHLGLQLLLLPADLLLRLLIELSHLVEMVRVLPAVTRDGTRQLLRNSLPGALLPRLPSVVSAPIRSPWVYDTGCTSVDIPTPHPIRGPHCPNSIPPPPSVTIPAP